jgi:hypothetical protein
MDPHYYISDAALDEGIGEIQLGLYREEGEKGRGLQVEEGNVAQVLSRMLHALDGQARGHKMAQHSRGPSCYVQVGGPRGNRPVGGKKARGRREGWWNLWYLGYERQAGQFDHRSRESTVTYKLCYGHGRACTAWPSFSST